MIVNGIDTRDISVIVQGAVGSYISTCLSSVREHLPGAELVLSTWKGTNVEGLDYDVLVLSDDPGGFDCFNDEFNKRNNVKRQVVSSREGLLAAKRKYAVKLRTDMSLTSHDFLNWYGKYPKRSKDSWFEEKMISCTIYARDPRNAKLKFPAHPSDFFFFGLRSDLLELFSLGLTSEEDRIWFARKYPYEFRYEIHRFVPEQFLWVNLLRRHIEDAKSLPDDIHDIRRETILLTERSFAANLILLSPEQLGLVCEKKGIWISNTETCYSHFDWYSLYAWYCERNPLPYCLYRLKTGGTNMQVRTLTILRKCGAPILRKAKEWAKKLAHKFMLWVKKHIRPNITDRRWAEWKLRFTDFKLELSRRIRRQKERYIIQTDGPDLSDSELSVVVQGAISEATKETLRTVRKVLPKAELILSTWEGSDTKGLDYDVLIQSRDPGSDGLIRRYPHKQIHNVSREITSTLAGIEAASRFFCLKIRSDMQILSDDFIRYYNQFSRYRADGTFFERRVMVNGTTTPRDLPNVGDWWYLGTKKDMKKFFDIPLYPKEDYPYFEQEENRKKHPFSDTLICRYVPETYIVYSLFKKMERRLPPMDSQFDYDPVYSELQKKLVTEELICIEPSLSGIVLPKARNVENPPVFRYLLPIEKWYAMVRDAGMVKRTQLPKEAANVLEQVYFRQPRWYDMLNWISIVKNYARFQTICFEKMPAFEKSDMTFVVCGRIECHGPHNTRRCLSSIRRFFPTSKIILATWKGEELDWLSGLYDELVLCDRPAQEKRDIYLHTIGVKKDNAINDQRYLVSTAMNRVNTRYAVKTRTDFYFINDNIFSFYQKWASLLDRREEGYQVFDARLLVSQYFTCNPRVRSGGYTYMLSDCFQMGLTGDLLKLWNGELIPDEMMNWFEEHPDCGWENPDQFNHRYNAEQFFFLSALQKTLPHLPYPQWCYDREREEYMFESEKVLASNVLTGDQRLLGLATKFDGVPADGLVPFNRLLELYLENVDPDNQACLDYLKKFY